jgi:hypothetical protein
LVRSLCAMNQMYNYSYSRTTIFVIIFANRERMTKDLIFAEGGRCLLLPAHMVTAICHGFVLHGVIIFCLTILLCANGFVRTA